MKTLKLGSKGEEVKLLQRALHLMDDGIYGPLTKEAVEAIQRRYGLVVDGICGQATWAVIPHDENRIRKSKRTINEIIVHCTATPAGRNVTVDEITKWHKQRGFTTIGYHYVVYLDGSIHEGRNVDISGAHCIGHNAHSIGVCYVGGCEKDGKTPADTRTKAQKEGLLWLINSLKDVYPRVTVHGHREYAAKSCPCFDAFKEYN